MDAKMTGARRTNGMCGRLVAKPNSKCHLKDLRVNGRIVLIWILNKYSMRMGIVCISVDIGQLARSHKQYNELINSLYWHFTPSQWIKVPRSDIEKNVLSYSSV
jgi:hypothetical protein